MLRDAEIDFDENDGGETGFLTLSTPEVLVQIAIVPSELATLARIRETDWDQRRTITAGRTADNAVHWSTARSPAAAIASIGDDPETAQVSVVLTEVAVATLIELAQRFAE